MRSLVVTGILLTVITHLTACSNDGQVVRKAPQIESDLGHLVFGASPEESQKYLKENTQARIRYISQKHNFFEIIDNQSNKASLSQYFPQARIHKNEFIHHQQQVSKVDEIAKNLALGQFHEAQTLLEAKDKTLAVVGAEINMNSCVKSSLMPLIKVAQVSKNAAPKGSLEVGDTIVLDASGSQPHAFTGGDLKMSWVIMSPLGSNNPQIVADKRLSLHLDTMGMYQVLVVVQDQKGVCHAEPGKVLVTGNEKFLLSNAKKDPRVANQSYLTKLGVDKAHEKTLGDGVLIAVVDSGVNYNHPHLAENIFINTNESDNGSDNDGNGFPGDIHGWDFVNDDAYPFDDNGHGSHVAGLSAGKVFGIAPNAKILPVKVSNSEGVGDLGSSLQGIIYSLEMGAKVINLSFGSYRPSIPVEYEVLKLAAQADAVILAAAGNGDPSSGMGINTDVNKNMPSGLTSPVLISVGALNEKNELTYYSNFGLGSVQIATYGGEDFDLVSRKPYDGQLISAYIPNPQGLMFHPAHGTSMSTPISAGIAALVRSLNPSLKADQVADILRHAGPTVSGLQSKIKSGKVLTAESAIALTPTLDQLQ